MTIAPTDLEIARGREDLAALLWERCAIRRRLSPGGGSFATIAADVPCRLASRGGQVLGGLVLSASDPHGDMTLSLPAGTDLRPGDQAIVQSREIAGGRRFEAKYVEPRQAFLMRVRGTVEG